MYQHTKGGLGWETELMYDTCISLILRKTVSLHKPFYYHVVLCSFPIVI